MRSKCYSLVTVDGFQKKAAAGVTKGKQKELRHEKYKKILKNSSIHTLKQRSIISKNLKLYTIEQERIALSAMDIKRYILRPGIKTLAYGHYKLN